MKKYLTGLMFGLALGGCAGGGCEGDGPRNCGSPCPHLMPLAVDEDTLLAAFKASALGRRLTREDQISASRVLQNLLRTGPLEETFVWHARGACESGPHGSFKVFHPTTQGSASCLNYIQTVTVEDQTHTAHGTACREYNGTWRVIREIPYEIHE